MHKTFTDCYLAQGFTGGGWGYALNTNDADGEKADVVEGEKQVLNEEERKLAYYCIGWESFEVRSLLSTSYDSKGEGSADMMQLHHAYAKTPLFDEEIDKLKPYFGEGTGAF